MIITTKNNEYVFIDSNEDFKQLISKEIGEDAGIYMNEIILQCEEYDSISKDYEELLEESQQLENDLVYLKHKLEMIEQGKEKEYFNSRIYNIIQTVKELDKVSKSQKVAGVQDEIIHMLKNMIIE